MEPNHDPDQPRDESDGLDAALRAAFAADSAGMRDGTGPVLDELERSSGISPRILLREAPADATEMVSPIAADFPGGCRGTGRYQIAGEIARGGVGVVLKGRDPDLGRDVAVKVLRDDHAHNPLMIRRLVEEAQIGGQLQHPGVLPVYEIGLDAGHRPYFTMKLIRGRTLAELLHDRADASHDRPHLLSIFAMVCQTMAYAHMKGVVHRDLKPSNIMVGEYGEVQVVDWGLAKVLARGGVADERRAVQAHQEESAAIATVRTGSPGSDSEAGSVFGTPSYMAPEQARGEVDKLDERTDVFALGAILCEILTGRPAYIGTRAQVLRQAAAGQHDEAMALLEHCEGDEELARLAQRCLAGDRHARPRDAGQLAREVSAYLESVAERARAAELAAAEARARAAGERRVLYLTVVLFAVILLGIAVGAGLYNRAEQQRWLAEERRREQLVVAVGLAHALDLKSAYMVREAAKAHGREAMQWADAMALTAKAIETLANNSSDEAIRRRASELLTALRSKEAETRQRVGVPASH